VRTSVPAREVGTAWVTLYRAPPRLAGTSRARAVLLSEGRLAQHVPMATSWFVGQPLQTRLKKALRPLIDKASADPDRVGNLGDGDPIGQKENNPAPSSTAHSDGGRTLPREQRLAFRRREADREGGCASTSHTETSQEGVGSEAPSGRWPESANIMREE